MDPDDRTARKKSRIRGSGKRNVQVDDFFVLSKQTTKQPTRKKRRLTDSLQSALNHWDNIENLPRLRNRNPDASSTSNDDSTVADKTIEANDKENRGKKPQNKLIESVQNNRNSPALGSNPRTDQDDSSFLTPAHLINQSIYDEIDYPNNSKEDNGNNGRRNGKTLDNPMFEIEDSSKAIKNAAKFTNKLLTKGKGSSSKKVTESISKDDTPRKRGRPPKIKRTGRPKKTAHTPSEPITKKAVEAPEPKPLRKSDRNSGRHINYSELPQEQDQPRNDDNDHVEFTKWLASQSLRKGSRLRQVLSGTQEVTERESREVSEEIETPKAKIQRIKRNVRQRQKDIENKTNSTKAAPKASSKNKGATKANKETLLPPVEIRAPQPRSPKRPTRVAPRTQSVPIPLLKTRNNERQKPLNVDIQRLRDDNNKDTRQKINTIDVLRHLVKTFEPEATDSIIVKQKIIQEDFRSHLLHQINYLMDVHSSINDISSRINEVRKLKNECRSRIYQLRQDHTAVGNELNLLRAQYGQEKDQFENFSVVHNELTSLKELSTKTTEESHQGLSQLVSSELQRLSSIVNPHSGIYHKLHIVNEKLSEVDKELP
ncbi:uncharacterized protein RJT20DRAFT_22007 [Scheffersomyces xylosifermentans]|uniref:uncharacterized protein n=1 Tax=Scheffersomyces xylosifermentans TaxID=1304137 RepID=UPI00315C5EEF